MNFAFIYPTTITVPATFTKITGTFPAFISVCSYELCAFFFVWLL